MDVIVERRPSRPAPWHPDQRGGHRFFDHPEHVPAFDAVRYLTVEIEEFDDVDVRRVIDRTTGACGTIVTAH
jgi:hypothetical protein